MKLLKNGYMIEGTAEEVFLLIKMDEQFEKRLAEQTVRNWMKEAEA